MGGTLVFDELDGRQCAAVIEDGRLAEILVESGESPDGSIYVGRVDNVPAGMQAAFVDIGLPKKAFLPENDLPKGMRLYPGLELPVQAVKVPGGEKGLRVSADVKLAGRMCVLMPFTAGIGISKKIADEDEHKRLRGIAERCCPKGVGLIVRTNAAGCAEEALQEDVRALNDKWESLQGKLRCVKAPALIYSDTDVVRRAVRDFPDGDTERIVASRGMYDAVKTELAAVSPAHLERLVCQTGEIAPFALYSVRSQVEKALARRVWLKSGAYLVFDYTEALTVIDVNTGKFTGNKSLSDTIFRVNTEAAVEIARQLRLRDIGGIIVIDFIDMDSAEQKNALLKTLKTECKRDRTHTDVAGITALGLVEMTRKRKRERLCDLFAGRDKHE